MVYFADTNNLLQNSISLRNMLFTGITRSRAWTRLCAWGTLAAEVKREFDQVKNDEFQLRFRIPPLPQSVNIYVKPSDRSDAEIAKLDTAMQRLNESLDTLLQNDVDLGDVPPEIRTKLGRLRMRQDKREN